MPEILTEEQTQILKYTLENMNSSKIEYGESIIFMSGTQPEKEIQQILDEIDKLLAESGMDDEFAAISQTPATTQSYIPATNETKLKKINHGDTGIGIEKIR